MNISKAIAQEIERAYQQGYVNGVKAASDIADQYNSSSNHEFRLGDCISCKLNVIKRKKPRLNPFLKKKFK